MAINEHYHIFYILKWLLYIKSIGVWLCLQQQRNADIANKALKTKTQAQWISSRVTCMTSPKKWCNPPGSKSRHAEPKQIWFNWSSCAAAVRNESGRSDADFQVKSPIWFMVSTHCVGIIIHLCCWRFKYTYQPKKLVCQLCVVIGLKNVNDA